MSAAELREELTRYLRERIAEGFDSREDMVTNAIEVCCEDHGDADVESLVRTILSEELERHVSEARSWPAVTDCDRLDAAFEQLNAIGIMARHNWTCCGNCGRAEMPDEFQRLDGMWEGNPIIGYTFYHQQNTENAATGEGLYSVTVQPNQQTASRSTRRSAFASHSQFVMH